MHCIDFIDRTDIIDIIDIIDPGVAIRPGLGLWLMPADEDDDDEPVKAPPGGKPEAPGAGDEDYAYEEDDVDEDEDDDGDDPYDDDHEPDPDAGIDLPDGKEVPLRSQDGDVEDDSDTSGGRSSKRRSRPPRGGIRPIGVWAKKR